MRTFALAAFVAAAQAYTELTAVDHAFLNFVVEHGKSYGTKEEYEARKELFAQADAEIKELNSMGLTSFHAHNFLSDWTEEERSTLLGYTGPQELNSSSYTVSPTGPASVDWRTQGAVNPVKNQGQCGSCWAFSATAAIEGHHAIATGKLESFAEQQIVDCDTTCAGCNGGW